jgi:hypothetical protein
MVEAHILTVRSTLVQTSKGCASSTIVFWKPSLTWNGGIQFEQNPALFALTLYERSA